MTPNRCTKIVFGPIAQIISRSDWSKPRIIAVMPTIDVMPITTPSTVSAERILLVRTVSNAIAMTSPKRVDADIGHCALSHSRLQRLDRIEARRAHGRIQTEEQADQRGDADAERHRPRLRPPPGSA